MRRDGRITACECEVVQRGGAYAGYGIITILYAGALLQGIYDIPAVKYDGYRVYANLPPCGAMRGHGGVNTRHAFECLLDRMARELGLDPFEVRRANLLHAPTRTLNELMVNSYGLAECLDKVERASNWTERIGKLPPGKGLGMACSHYVSGAAKPVHWTGEPHAAVSVRLDFDGGITALTGAADIGQGSSTMVAIAVAETLGISLDRVRVIAADTAITPKDNGSYSSRVTFMVGNAAIDAARRLKAILVEAAAQKLESRPEDVECIGEVFRVGTGSTIRPPLRGGGEGGARRSRPDHGDGNFHLPARGPGRQASRRCRRGDDGVQLRRASRRSHASMKPPAESASTRSGRRSIAGTRSMRWRSKARSRGRCGWAWARR